MDAHTISFHLPKQATFSHRQKRLHKAHLASLQAEYLSLMKELSEAQQSLSIALNNFPYLSEPSAIDACIYQLKSAQSQYDNILMKLKPLRLTMTHASELD